MLPSAATLAPTPLIDSGHPAVAAFAAEHACGADTRTRAVALYLAVRDGFRYDPYRIDLSPAGMKASAVIATGHGWCVPKAALLAAACRAAGIPARVGYADVRNHLSTERMRQTMQTDLFVWHGYTEVWLDVGGTARWVKATPAFNLSLCERFGLLPLDWDGRSDSLYHPFDAAGQRHMEYVAQRGSFDDVPLAAIVESFRTTYPGWGSQGQALQGDDFQADVARGDGILNGPDVPAGFLPAALGGDFIRVNGPLYLKRGHGSVLLGFRVEPRHTNPAGILHGGMMASFCDMLLPICGHHQDKALAGHFLPTINLQIDYLAPSPLGAWVEGEAQVLRSTATLTFIQGLVTADGAPVARASGIFKIGPLFERPPAPG